ncbi:MAG: haloacid dehalogenase type II [Kiloniellales bacterium]
MTGQTLGDIAACVFDVYGTLVDFESGVREVRDKLGDKADALSRLWREKQLQYAWLGSLMDHHEDFWHLTGHALDYAMEALDMESPPIRAELMQLYLQLKAYPEVPETLRRVKQARLRTAILSNGSPTMLAAVVNSAGLHEHIDTVLSVEEAGIYKPHANVYRLVPERMAVEPKNVCFLSANGWDAHAAAHFGFKVLWVNRGGLPRERLPGSLEGEIGSLAELPAWLGL